VIDVRNNGDVTDFIHRGRSHANAGGALNMPRDALFVNG
jgi:hypothetical protein